MDPGEGLYVRVYNPRSYNDEEFYAKLLEGGRITIPKLVVELLKIEPKDVVYVTLYTEKPPEEEED